MNTRRITAGLSALALGLSLSACGGGDDDLADRTNTAEPQLRLIHAAPLAPALTLYRNGTADASGSRSYKGFSAYHDTFFGTATLALRATSAPSVDLDTATADTQRGRKYTAVALTDGVGADLVLIDDPYTKPVGNDQARLRVVNGASNTTSVDVYVTTAGADLNAVVPTFAGLAYKQVLPASGSDATQFSEGTYRLRLTPTGAKTPVIFDVTLTLTRNEDVVLVTVPADAVAAAPNDVHVLRVRSDDATGVATELTTTP